MVGYDLFIIGDSQSCNISVDSKVKEQVLVGVQSRTNHNIYNNKRLIQVYVNVTGIIFSQQFFL